MLIDSPSLSDKQIQSFHRDGFLTIDGITSQKDIEQLIISYDRIFNQQEGRSEGDQFDLGGVDGENENAVLPQILDPAKYAPDMNDSLLLKNTKLIAKQLLGEKANCEFFHAIYKPPYNGAETPWHQDAAYWDNQYIHNEISIWVPLQEATEENGCMQFIPGSHKHDVHKHRSINNDPRIHGLELDPGESKFVNKPVICPLSLGGATIHDGYTLHYTGPNQTNTGRRALILSAKVDPIPRKSSKSFPWLEEKNTARLKRVADSNSN